MAETVRKHGKNKKKWGYMVARQKQNGKYKQKGNKAMTKREYMEEMWLGHKPVEINSVIDLRVELCGCVCEI